MRGKCDGNVVGLGFFYNDSMDPMLGSTVVGA